MSIEPTSGPVLKWRVRWRDADGAHSRRVRTKKQAEVLDLKVKEAKAIGDVSFLRELVGQGQTLAEFVDEKWWPNHVVPHLAATTRKQRRSQWEAHIKPALGRVVLGDITVERLDIFAGELVAKELKPNSRRVILQTLHQILQKALDWGYLRENPMTRIQIPGAKARETARPLVPEQVEAIRAEMNLQDATIVSVLAYTGVRPQELRKLEWDDFSGGALMIRAEVAKTGTLRVVRLSPPVRADIHEWRLKEPGWRTGLVFPGLVWDSFGLRFKAAAGRAGLYGVVPYDLRHSFVSLLIQSGAQILEVARAAGHSPTMTLETYGHLFDTLDPTERVDVEDLIREARTDEAA
jgi:integrase